MAAVARVIVLLACLLGVAGEAILLGQTAPAQLPATTQPAAPAAAAGPAGEAPVVYFNRRITVFRSTLFGTSPENRARRTEAIIDQLLDRSREGVVTTQSEPQGNLILIDGELALILTESDVDRLRGETLEQATEAAAGVLRQVIDETREARNRDELLKDALAATINTIAFAVILALIFLARRYAHRSLRWLSERAAAATHVGGTQVVTAERLLPIATGVLTVVIWVATVIAAYRWLSQVLSQFPYTRPWGEQLAAFFVDTAVGIGQGIVAAVPGLVVAAFIILAARVVMRLIRPFFEGVERGYVFVPWLDADTARPTKRIFMLLVWLFAVAMAYPYLPGSQTEAFRGISVLFGAMITFGGSSLFGQAASGMILMYSRTLRVGEYVRIADHEGTVTELGTFTTKVRTGLGEELTLPNAVVLGGVVKNYSRTVRGAGYVVDTTVTIGYDTPWRQVEAMLVEAARRTPGILEIPPPVVFQTSLSDFYPEYRLVCQAIPREPRPRAEVLTQLHANIQDVFNEHGVQIMSPHYVSDPTSAKVVPEEQWYAAPAAPPEHKTG